MLKSLFNWRVLLNFVLALGVFAGLVWLTFRWLDYHTQHGKEVPVPNVMNMPVQNAIKTLDDSGLDYEVDSFQFDPKYRPYQVLQVYPSPGSRVKYGRNILLKVNPRTWAKVVVPDVLNRYKGLAFRQLEQVGLKVGDTIYEPNIQRDAVIRLEMNGTNIKPGTQVPRFSVLDVVIGTGPKRNVPVPNVVGMTVGEARKMIASYLFEVGLVTFEDGTGSDSEIVYYQDPAVNELRDQGMQIDIWASKKSPAQMSVEIRKLDEIYRVKIDTTLPPIRYEEIPVEPYRPQPVPIPADRPRAETPAPKPEKSPVEQPRREEPKPAAQPKKETKAPTANRPEPAAAQPAKTAPSKSSEKPKKAGTEEKPANAKPAPKAENKPPAEEKPKVRKVIVE